MRFCSLLKLLLMGAFIGFLFWGCSDQYASGNSAETGNPEIVGVLHLSGGVPANAAKVRCIPFDFNFETDRLSDVRSTVTDSLGNFKLDSLPEGICNMEADHQESGTKLLIYNLLPDLNEKLQLHASLDPTGSLRLGLKDLSGIADGDSGVVYVAGTSIAQHVVVRYSSIVVENLPAALLDSLYFKADKSDTVSLLGTSLQVVPEKLQELKTNPITDEWIVNLNTTSSGVEVNDKLIGFPLVWRPDSTQLDFDFIHLNKGHFSAFRGDIPLGLKVAQWDSKSKSAVFWIRVDTLHSQSSTQPIRIRFQEELDSLPLVSNSPFARSDSVAAVWHFEEALSSDSAVEVRDVPDAGPFGWHGVGYQLHPSEGMVGSAFWFNGTNSYIDVPGSESGELNLEYEGPATISVWARLDIFNTSRFVLGKGVHQYYLKYQYPTGWLFENNDDQVPTVYHWLKSPLDSLQDVGKWFHLAVVMDTGGVNKLYVNGSLADSTPVFSTASMDRSTDSPFEIGRRILPDKTVGQHFWGVLDEVMVWRRAQSDEWIKLLWANQNKEMHWP